MVELLKKFIIFLSGTIFAIVLGYFFGPLEDPINDFAKGIFYGEPEINIYISRNYATFNPNEKIESIDEYLLSTKHGAQILVFKKIISELPNKKSFKSFYLNTLYPYNYLVYIKNDGPVTAKDIDIILRMDVDDYDIFDVDSAITYIPESKGGLIAYEKTFRFHIDKLKSGKITSLRLAPNQLSDIEIDCELEFGKCNYGINDHIIYVLEELPTTLKTIFHLEGKDVRHNIIVPDLRKETKGLFSYNFTMKEWVRETEPFEIN